MGSLYLLPTYTETILRRSALVSGQNIAKLVPTLYRAVFWKHIGDLIYDATCCDGFDMVNMKTIVVDGKGRYEKYLYLFLMTVKRWKSHVVGDFDCEI